jgi:hypothetical protein
VLKLKKNYFFNIRRRNIVIFSKTKSNFNFYLSILRCLRKESIFKTKGIMLKRSIIKRKIPRSILFARRIKFAKIKLKLSKKQKLV